MQKYQNNIINTNGVPVVGASVTITTYPGGATATLYSDNGVTTTPNPLTTDAFGIFSFYAADGRYSAAITGAGVTPSSVTDILLEDPADGNPAVITGGTINATTIGATTPSSGAFTTLSASTSITSAGAIATQTGGFQLVSGVAGGTTPYIQASTTGGAAAPLNVYIGGTVALAINSSGSLQLFSATTAAAPAYVKGAMYFDTTLNKLRIGGATAWETVTSV